MRRYARAGDAGGAGMALFCHSPQSWARLWEEACGAGAVEVRAALEDTGTVVQTAMGLETDQKHWMLTWSVRRL